MRKIVAGLMVSVDRPSGRTRRWSVTTWPREIARLKEQPGKNSNVSGSAILVALLLAQGLLDELNLLLFPVVVGHGKRLFGGEGSQSGLTLASCEAFSTGVVQLIHHPAGA